MAFNLVRDTVEQGEKKISMLCFSETNQPKRLCFLSRCGGNMAIDYLFNNGKITIKEAEQFRQEIARADFLLDEVPGGDMIFYKHMRESHGVSKRADH